MVHATRQLLADCPLLLLVLLLTCQSPAAGRVCGCVVSSAGAWLSRQKGFGGNWVADVVALQLGDHDLIDLVLCHFAGMGCFKLIHKFLKLLWHQGREQKWQTEVWLSKVRNR
jgi:hypothetical protein